VQPEHDGTGLALEQNVGGSTSTFVSALSI